jgi:hypothetical protein
MKTKLEYNPSPVQIGIELSDELIKLFLKPSGGNNREWSKRFKSMIDRHKIMKELTNNQKDRIRLEGYEMCMKCFLTEGKL